MLQAMTREELLALPASTNLVTAARAFGIGKSKAYEMAASGQFPVKVLRLGKSYRVRTADLLTMLGIDLGNGGEPARSSEAARNGAPAPLSVDQRRSGRADLQ